MKEIDKVKDVDMHIDFYDNEKFSFSLNGGDTDGARIPLDQLRKIARTLSRIAVGMWTEIDKATE